MKKLVMIRSKTCRFCVVQAEILRRLLPKFPDITLEMLERDDDAEECKKYEIHGVPVLVLDGNYLTGSHTMRETELFLKGELNDAVIDEGIKNPHYLDNAATTPVCDEAAKAAVNAMKETFGNPSSVHFKGRQARSVLEQSRHTVAEALGAEDGEIFFTSCGSESDNWAIISGAGLMSDKGRHIISGTAEHDAVRKSLDFLEEKGFEITRLSPGKDGTVSPESVKEALREDTVLVSLMTVNNETGAVNDIKGIRKVLDESGSIALLHTDAVQAFGKIEISAHDFGADMISVSGHKIHAPKGIGALYVREGIDLPSLILGGGQESGKRAGTEAVPQIAAFAAAAEAASKAREENAARMRGFKDQVIKRLGEMIPGFRYIDTAAPHILSISLPGTRSENTVNYLSDRGIYVSNSSACKRGARSHVLEAMGMDDEYIDGALRISFSRLTTQADIDALCEVLAGQ